MHLCSAFLQRRSGVSLCLCSLKPGTSGLRKSDGAQGGEPREKEWGEPLGPGAPDLFLSSTSLLEGSSRLKGDGMGLWKPLRSSVSASPGSGAYFARLTAATAASVSGIRSVLAAIPSSSPPLPVSPGLLGSAPFAAAGLLPAFVPPSRARSPHPSPPPPYSSPPGLAALWEL